MRETDVAELWDQTLERMRACFDLAPRQDDGRPAASEAQAPNGVQMRREADSRALKAPGNPAT